MNEHMAPPAALNGAQRQWQKPRQGADFGEKGRCLRWGGPKVGARVGKVALLAALAYGPPREPMMKGG
jgi:hypothetical protein